MDYGGGGGAGHQVRQEVSLLSARDSTGLATEDQKNVAQSDESQFLLHQAKQDRWN